MTTEEALSLKEGDIVFVPKETVGVARFKIGYYKVFKHWGAEEGNIVKRSIQYPEHMKNIFYVCLGQLNETSGHKALTHEEIELTTDVKAIKVLYGE